MMRRRYRYLNESAEYDANVEALMDKNFIKKMSSTLSGCNSVSDTKKMTPKGPNEILAQYVFALIKSALPCPKTNQELQDTPFYSKVAKKILEYGFTIDEVNQLYDANYNKFITKGAESRLKDKNQFMSMMTSNNYNTNPGYEDEDNVVDNYPGYNDDDDDIEDPRFNRRRGPFDRSAREETNFDDMFLSDEDENGFMEEEEEEEDLEVVQHREYMEKMRKKIVDVAIGDFLVYNWNNPSDIKVVKPTWRAPRGEQWKVFAKCVIKAYQVDSDPKARFVPIGLGKDGKYRIYTIPNVSIEHKGNNDLYKTFEYNSENIGGRTVFTPASSYYTDDIKFGKEYTKTLANIGNEAAVQCINYDRNGVLAELKGEWYLPTFEELCKAMNNRAIVDNKGIYYWSSSVPGRDEEDEDTSRQNYNYAVSSDDIFILSNYSSSHGTETIRPTMNAYVLPFLKF